MNRNSQFPASSHNPHAPWLELIIDYPFLETEKYFLGRIIIHAGPERLHTHQQDLTLVRSGHGAMDEQERWSENSWWSDSLYHTASIPAGSSMTIDFRFALPTDVTQGNKPQRHQLKAQVFCLGHVALGTEAEVHILAPIDIPEEEDIDNDSYYGLMVGNQGMVYGDKRLRPHALHDYLDRFQSMVNDLLESPMVVVLNHGIFPPVTTANLAAVERQLGFTLPAAMRTFYMQTNGLQLRWIKVDNPSYDPNRHPSGQAPLPWDWIPEVNAPEDGIVMLMPIEHLIIPNTGADAAVLESAKTLHQVHYLNHAFPLTEFQQQLRIMDRFSHEAQAILFLSPLVEPCLHLGRLDQIGVGESFIVDFGTYLEFLIARLGLVAGRTHFLKPSTIHRSILYYGPKAYWEWQMMDATYFVLARDFPLASQIARGCEFNKEWFNCANEGLDSPWISYRRRQLEDHRKWVEKGGYVYNWTRFKANGKPWLIALSAGNNMKPMNESLGRLDGISWKGANLPYLGFAAMDARGIDASAANLIYSVFIHSNFEGANFAGANLRAVDFTGCNLRNANFQGADLAGTDFEIADLRGADFTGANTNFARFPGANLRGIKRNTPNSITQTAPIRSRLATLFLLLNDVKVKYLVADIGKGDEQATFIPYVVEENLWGFSRILADEQFHAESISTNRVDLRKLILESAQGSRIRLGSFIVLIGDYNTLLSTAEPKLLDGVPYLAISVHGS